MYNYVPLFPPYISIQCLVNTTFTWLITVATDALLWLRRAPGSMAAITYPQILYHDPQCNPPQRQKLHEIKRRRSNGSVAFSTLRHFLSYHDRWPRTVTSVKSVSHTILSGTRCFIIYAGEPFCTSKLNSMHVLQMIG
jgi:hypothetical protein